TFVLNTAQHSSSMTESILAYFEIESNYTLRTTNDGLASLMSQILKSVDKVLHKLEPDMVIVQGDTISSAAGALAAFYRKIPVSHVEAGLRTY
ncbi:UDP-N-acetyl glucosamine 2-epimerase, partial [Streptomyces sp. CHA1]|uniref:UDP-N-acetylglucosamine 2-epimerase n=1 Tax=Streptomyces sp. CHA1 TaxID=2841663 RepID=UPI0025B477B9